MDRFQAIFDPFALLIINAVLIILVFLFLVKPLLNYFVVNREIENRKKLTREYQIAKREAEVIRKEKKVGEGKVWVDGTPKAKSSDQAEQANKQKELMDEQLDHEEDTS